MDVIISPNPTEEEAAAAFAAIAAYTAYEQQAQADETLGDWRWQASALLTIQKVPITRAPTCPSWGNIERLRRAGPGSTGITGL